MGDLGGCQQAQSLVSMFDELCLKKEEASTEVYKTGPEYFLKVLEVSALAEVRGSELQRESQGQILSLEREVERLQSQILSDDQKRSEELDEVWQEMILLEQENARLESKEVASEELSRAQQQQILQLEQEVLANQRKSELLAEARQQNHQLEEKLKKVQLESEAKCKEIDEIQAELLLLRKYQEDLDNHNHVILCDSTLLEFTKDISCPTEDCFPGGASAMKKKLILTSTPAPATRIIPRKKWTKRRSMSLDLQLPRTPIIPGLCQKCASRGRGRQPGEDSLDSPTLPWCPHGAGFPGLSGLNVSRASPTLTSAELLLQPTRGAMRAVASKHLRKIV